jgi:hypothetical protein
MFDSNTIQNHIAKLVNGTRMGGCSRHDVVGGNGTQLQVNWSKSSLRPGWKFPRLSWKSILGMDYTIQNHLSAEDTV